jgi:hypothetical protein
MRVRTSNVTSMCWPSLKKKITGQPSSRFFFFFFSFVIFYFL